MAVGSSPEDMHGYAHAVRGKSRAEKQKDWNAPQEERQDEKRRTEAGRESCGTGELRDEVTTIGRVAGELRDRRVGELRDRRSNHH